jgi:hypothetical protein
MFPDMNNSSFARHGDFLTSNTTALKLVTIKRRLYATVATQ